MASFWKAPVTRSQLKYVENDVRAVRDDMNASFMRVGADMDAVRERFKSMEAEIAELKNMLRPQRPPAPVQRAVRKCSFCECPGHVITSCPTRQAELVSTQVALAVLAR
jgi:hypothetical protein